MGWDDRKTSAYLGRLVTAGRLERPARGLYTPVGSVGSDGFEYDIPNTPNTPNASVGEAAA
jgi:hypothetical protein